MAALDPKTGLAYELHHIGQNPDGTLAILTQEEHRAKGITQIWHKLGEASKIDRPEFDKQRGEFWKAIAEMYAPG